MITIFLIIVFPPECSQKVTDIKEELAELAKKLDAVEKTKKFAEVNKKILMDQFPQAMQAPEGFVLHTDTHTY